MGSWNKTCGLSSLHITAGTPVYVFVLEKNDSIDDCYSTSLYAPLLFPFESVYDDYGGGEDSSGVALPRILAAIKEQLVEMPLGDNEYHDIAVAKEEFNEDLFFEAIHEGRLFIKNQWTPDKPTAVQFTMFRKDIVEAILEKRHIEEYVGHGKGNFAKYGNEMDYDCYYFKDVVADIAPLIASINDTIDKTNTELKHGGKLTRAAVLDLLYPLLSRESENRAGRWLNNYNHRFSRILDMRAIMHEAFSNEPISLDEIAELLEVHLKGLFIESFMTAARKTWIPGGHEGSQSYSGAALRLLADATLNVLDAEKKEWLAENEGDESTYIED